MSKTQTNALVPVVQSLPATENFRMPEDVQRQIRARFENEVDWRYGHSKNQVNIIRGMSAGMGAMFGAITAGMPPIAFITVPTMALLYWAGMDMQRDVESAGYTAFEKVKEDARQKFEQAQREFYAAQKKHIIGLADAHIGNGNLLSLQDAAWLGNIDPGQLADATDQLAVTVLQIRGMLAHERCQEFNSDGSKKVEKPITFQGVGFDVGRALHRSWLREKLAQLDCGIEEDNKPGIQDVEFSNDNVARPGLLKAAFKLVNPFANWNRKEKILAMEEPKVKDVELECVQPVVDFAAALEAYESRNPPLDLPAVRGWKVPQRRALPAPKGLV